jgi:thioredoxin 1
MSLQTSFGAGHEQVTQFASHWREPCLKDFEFENAIKKMNTSQKKIPMLEIGEANFESEVLRRKQPVLVGFSASWSRPCHVLDSVLREVASACAGSVQVVKVNADDNPDLSLWYEIQSIPTLLYFVDGSLRAKIVGTASKEAILYKLRSISQGGDSKTLNPERFFQNSRCWITESPPTAA